MASPRLSSFSTHYQKRPILFPLLTFLAIAFAATVAYEASAADNQLVILELKKLRDSLPAADGQRKELNLRIADLLANECLVSSNGTAAARSRDCAESFLLFSETVDGTSVSRQSKIRFQMARIALERGDRVRAKPLFERVLAEADAPELRREASLRLAEIAEASPATVKDAVVHYRKALELCNGGDSCSFAHYRIAWIHKNEGNLPASIEEMKLAIYDSKGQSRQESVRDLVSFMGQDAADPAANIAFVEEVGAKISRPEILQDLAYSYFTSGNKPNGVKTLEIVQARTPTIINGLRLLEENYGLRNWDRFQYHLTALTGFAQDPAKLQGLRENANGSKESEQIAKRLAVQLDGERATNPQHAGDFKAFSNLTLTLFPANPDRSKIMEGVIAAETDADAKLAQLKQWLESPLFTLTREEKINLHELRAGIAQKAAKNEIVVEEMGALLALSTGPKAREYRYARAKAQYDLKNFAVALPEFREIAASGLADKNGPDAFAIQSQNLSLDILNQQKDLVGLSAQAKLWTENESLKKNAKLSSELHEMSEVSSQAEFQRAVALGATVDALALFRGYCEGKRFTPQSCDNARTLAIQLNRHDDLIAVLKTTGNTADLASELEAGGRFAEAAKLQEATLASLATAGVTDYLRTALLYELGGDFAARDRVLNLIPKKAGSFKAKPSEPEQLALVATAADADVLTSPWLKAPGFSDAYRAQVAERLEHAGRGTKETHAILMARDASTGLAWENLVWTEARRLEAAEAKIDFHTKDGQRQFQRRVAALKSFSQFLEKKLPGSSSELRVRLLRLSQNSHQRIAGEIHGSPIPDGLTDEQKIQIKASLAEMAHPFEERNEAIAKLLDDEVQKVQDPAERGKVTALAKEELSRILSEPTEDAAAPKAVASVATRIDSARVAPLHAQLGENPKNAATLAALKTYYEETRQIRLSKYYEGRLNQLNAPSQEATKQ